MGKAAGDYPSARGDFKPPFLIVNPKAYLGGMDIVKLAVLTDKLAIKFDVDVLFTAHYVDLRRVAEWTKRLTVTAQHMDPLRPGRGMGRTPAEFLKDTGAKAVILNHAENPITVAGLDASIDRARKLGLMSIVCADSDAQCRAVAEFGPDIMICEPTGDIGTGKMSASDYAERTTAQVKAINPNIMVIQAAGVSKGADVTRVLEQGADGSGGTSGIIMATSWEAILTEMLTAIKEFKTRARARR